MATPTDKRITRTKLIREEFFTKASEAVKEIKALTDLDKDQLASAIARNKGITQEECDFVFVQY